MQILRRLKRGQKDPNPYPVRCKRRRKRPRSAAAGGEWYTWGRVHDKQDGRTADYLPHEYVDSLEGVLHTITVGTVWEKMGFDRDRSIIFAEFGSFTNGSILHRDEFAKILT